ncbi:MAG: SPOR domain-containing protein [Melioribacter sp.]|uniref:SPOR domain-containing protein n=1 Tax=Rosettibacter primus TaxID=3111523 RepID=UPI00247CDEAD|nr:SPOR domain-containing protein [Melioribacter sp.]
MKKFFCLALCILIIISHLVINAQILSKKWEKVISIDDKEIYLDTSSIKQEKNILSALMITYYQQPKFINEINQEIIYVKTQTLFDTVSRKVNIIGNLYYDKKLKIVGDAYKPIQIARENNVCLIDTSKIFSALYEKCINYIKFHNQNKQDKVDLLSDIKSSNIESKKLNSSINDTGKTISLEPELNVNEENYDLGAERLVYKTIFTDGNKFCVQVSSWKEKWKAEREVSKLRNMGHNAFIVKVNIPGKGIWYRVRIGYFSTLTEVEDYVKNMK